MSDSEMLVAMFSIACGSAIVLTFILSLRSIIMARVKTPSGEILEELRQLRAEVGRLRSENHDVILSFDAGLQRMDRRLEYLEGTRPLGAASAHHTDREAAAVIRAQR